jgi:hypothetical protein
MTMGDRIKTRQQLLDEQTDATNSRTAPGDDRHKESARPHQAHDSTAEHADQDDTEIQGDADAARQELAEMHQRMAVIKHEITIEVDRNWVSPWQTPHTFDLKVKTRLTGHQEYRFAAGPCPGHQSAPGAAVALRRRTTSPYTKLRKAGPSGTLANRNK